MTGHVFLLLSLTPLNDRVRSKDIYGTLAQSLRSINEHQQVSDMLEATLNQVKEQGPNTLMVFCTGFGASQDELLARHCNPQTQDYLATLQHLSIHRDGDKLLLVKPASQEDLQRLGRFCNESLPTEVALSPKLSATWVAASLYLR